MSRPIGERLDSLIAERDELRELADAMAHGIESLFSSLPFSAPENVAFLAQARLNGPLRDYRTAEQREASS